MAISSIYNPSFSEISDTAAQLNAINRSNQQAANLSRIPGEPNLEEQSSQNIMSELRGEVPQDVLALLGQQGAEGAVGTGTASQAAYLKALGITSLGQQQAGQANLSAATARNPGAPVVDASQFYISPLQSAQLNLQEQQLELQRERERAQEAQAQRAMTLQAQEAALRGGGGGGGGVARGGVAAPAPAPATGYTQTVIPSSPAYNMFGPIGPGNPAYPTGPTTWAGTYMAPEASTATAYDTSGEVLAGYNPADPATFGYEGAG